MDSNIVKYAGALCYSLAVSNLESLNERQRAAALHIQGPLLVVAGAGAGKTRTLVHRIAHLIECGVPAGEILAVTFTNKAAREMRERVYRILAREAQNTDLNTSQRGVLVSTFHALGVRILREFYECAGIMKNFTIWDREDSTKALKTILMGLGSDLAPRSVLSAISRAKGDCVSHREYREKGGNHWTRSVAAAWNQYDKTLNEEGALDFDDLLIRTVSLLRSNPEVLSLLQSRWTFLLVDEYQDTNKAQVEITRLLAGEKKNVCVVGDIDQNIYSWRGADIEHLLSFEETFPGCNTITLEENYRSTRTILAAANGVIEKNVRRKPKTLFTRNETGEPIFFYGAENEIDEAWFIAESVRERIERGKDPEGMAILYRENFQSRVLEEAFLRLSVPYRVLGTRFFERKEVRDVLSYLRAALNPKGKSDLARIISVPPRGIGKITLQKMLSNDDERIPKAAREKISAFREILRAIRSAAETCVCSEAMQFALLASGIEQMFEKDPGEGSERLGNVRELVNLSTKYDRELPPRGIERLLEDAALQSEHDEPDQDAEKSKRAVSLMTIHASKGLEFDTVYITGLEQGLFPSERADDSERDPEEERRLFYVGLTRAVKRLYLTYARQRMKYGSREHTIPSEFLNDIDPRLMAETAPEKREAIID